MDMVIKAVIEPPDDHPNMSEISGERIPVTIIIDGAYEWHHPFVGWTITEILKEVTL